MVIPEKYNFLESIPDLPRIVKIGLSLIGTKEIIGSGNNATILSWALELGIENTYNADAVPWCGLLIGVVVLRSGRVPVKNPLWAANWSNFGVPVEEPMLGDIIVFKRPGGNHVAIYIAEDATCYHILGGNQSDRVNIIRKKKSEAWAFRRPVYVNQPACVKKYFVQASGEISTNEA